MRKLILGSLLSWMVACSPYDSVNVAHTEQGLQTNFGAIIGWGIVPAKQSVSCTTGPGPKDSKMHISCYTQELPPGIDYTCYSPANGAIEMVLTNNNNNDINVGNRWAGAVYGL